MAAIENELQFLPLSMDDDYLRTRVARAICDDPYSTDYAEAATPPIHIVVNGGSVTLVGTANSELERSRAERDTRLVGIFLPVQNNLGIKGQGAMK
jgi:osmotically-inducible protein OsmY